jgi:hypothetical protein
MKETLYHLTFSPYDLTHLEHMSQPN